MMNGFVLFAAILLGGNNDEKYSTIVVDTFDVVELNHVYTENASKHSFDQIIWYKFKSTWKECEHSTKKNPVKKWEHDYEIVSWIIIKPELSSGIYPSFNFDTRYYIQSFLHNRFMRKIRSNSFRETWTNYDAESSKRWLTYPIFRIKLSK